MAWPLSFRSSAITPRKRPGREVEGDNVILADAVQLTARPEPQSARSGELVTLPGGTDPGGQVQLAAVAEAESSRERNGAVRQEQFAFGIESRWQGQDRAAAPERYAGAAVRRECAADALSVVTLSAPAQHQDRITARV
jgi:hypothetical protein